MIVMWKPGNNAVLTDGWLCALTCCVASVQERGFVASSTKGAGARSSGFTGQSVDKVAAGGAGESGLTG